MIETKKISRRNFLGALLLSLSAWSLGIRPVLALTRASLKKNIPATGQYIPAIGMGSWITFNVGQDQKVRDQRKEVLQAFFDLGGGLIDSSPMYGSSEEVIGYCLQHINNKPEIFTATKIWTWFSAMGPSQIAQSKELWGVKIFDLIQIHNLLTWEEHLKTLKKQKAEGGVRYIGVTTSHGRRHQELETIMQNQEIDFVQFSYNILDREAETRLLPLAVERNIAVIINRPFRTGQLFDLFHKHSLPDWAKEIDCTNWAQFLLKFVISHPAVTCAIPATSSVDHMRQNMGALYGRMPDQAMRKRMIDYVENL